MEATVHEGAAAAVAALRGELDVATADEVERELLRVERLAVPLVVLDLRELTFIDSTGLRLVLATDARLREAGRRLVVVRARPPVHRVFEISLLDERLEFVSTPDELHELAGGG